ncbi:MAG TPA: pilus assembly PilX N-terminal domain-containing protein [Candidatus Saccharimonadales bacterium]|nr:pilus assembly PilX N-terminal domain-containing protein [Candidatus Saccharimonadales bacterium]
MMSWLHKLRVRTTDGFILPGVIAFMLAMSIIGVATVTVILTNFEIVGNDVRSQQAFNVAEAGINYYLWHLSHNGGDYKDGQGTPATQDPNLGYGPYVHNYIDDSAQTTGTYTLWVKPQGNGSTLVTVRSIGQVTGSKIARTVQAQIGAASFASYGLVADTEFWFGSNESANGPVFSNVGIRMDGTNSDTVSSANATYTPQGKYGGDGGSHPGVWCNTSVTTPNCNTRNKTSWLYPKTTVDFNQVSTSLCTMKKTAFADYASTASLAALGTACSQLPATRTNAYIPETATSYSATKGYLIQLNTNGTYDLYKVTGEDDTAANYTAALTKTAVATGIALPPSGVIFVEDNVWVRTNPTFHGRVTIASGRLASGTQSTNINIADQLLYTAKDGSDAVGLVSEGNVYIQPYAPSNASGSFNFEVDAAALAQTGSVTWPQYYAGTNSCTKGWVNSTQTFTFYGSVATRQDWTWNYQMGGGCGSAVRDTSTGYYISGIEHTNTNYDYNLLYAPPPSYPITGTYNILSWREVLTRP